MKRFIIWILAIIGFVFFAFEAYNSRSEITSGLSMIVANKSLLLSEFTLMIINICLEAYRWQIIDRQRNSSSFFQSFTTILESISLSLITPGGVGEHIGKIHHSPKKKESLVASLIGSIIQTLVISFFGIIALLISTQYIDLKEHTFFYLLITSIIVVLSILFGKKISSTIKSVITSFSFIQLSHIFFINIIRYFVFAIQLYLILCNNFILRYDVAIEIAIYYLIITIVPSWGLADIGIRGSVAIFIFKSPDIFWPGTAVVLVWFINRVIPSLFYILLFRYKSIK